MRGKERELKMQKEINQLLEKISKHEADVQLQVRLPSYKDVGLSEL
jgi:hypothetical protein